MNVYLEPVVAVTSVGSYRVDAGPVSAHSGGDDALVPVNARVLGSGQGEALER